jgi:hypothetical protein
MAHGRLHGVVVALDKGGHRKLSVFE